MTTTRGRNPILVPLLCASLTASAFEAIARPNIVLFVVDDHTATDCGAYGSSDVHTPNIDRLTRISNAT